MMNHLEKEVLQGSEVIFDRYVSHPAIKMRRGGYYSTKIKKIIGFKNPDLILIIKSDNSGSFFGASIELLELVDYKEKHQLFLKKLKNYIALGSGGARIYELQEIIDREEELFDEIMSKYNSSE